MPPREKPTTLNFFNPRASQNATACPVISETVPGVSLSELPTPVLSNRMTSYLSAKPSVTSGS
jgi:hypothetical protein